jgi:hypothetical protein
MDFKTVNYVIHGSAPLSDPWITSFIELKSMVYILAGGQGGRSMNCIFYRLGVLRDAK